jgi:hypothetical protein
METNNYKCTQPELYAVARTGWASYAANLPLFSAYRGYYDAAYGTAALAAIDAAELLPSEQARYANTEVYRTELVTIADNCLALWQTLKRYILTSFAEPAIKARLEEAGSLRYEKAGNYNWEELRMMNVEANLFITTHNAALSAGLNMPATFPTAYSAAATAFAAKMQQFINSEEQGIIATNAKITANNNVHSTLMNMFKDGQEIFKTQDDIKRQFVFETVLGLITNPGAAGLRGKVTSVLDGSPIQGASVIVLSTSQSTTTDAAGNYLLKPLSAGRYDISFVAALYQDKVLSNIQVSTGVTSTLDAELDPLP